MEEKRVIRASELNTIIPSWDSCNPHSIICINNELTREEKKILKEWGAKMHVGQTRTRFIFPENVEIVNDIPDPTKPE